VIVADAVKEGEDVDGTAISKSWKLRTNSGKLTKMLLKAADVAEGHIALQAKEKAIPAEKVEPVKELAHS